MSEAKKRRNPNWEDAEKTLLQTCTNLYANLLENKATDTNSNKSKMKAWKSVEQNFNEANSRRRSLDELKMKWRMLKQYAKKQESSYNKACRATRGGPKPPSPRPPEVSANNEMIPNEFVTDENVFGSDYIYEGKLKLIKEEHNLKIKLRTEKHEWERLEHKLRTQNLQLQNMILQKQIEEM